MRRGRVGVARVADVVGGARDFTRRRGSPYEKFPVV